MNWLQKISGTILTKSTPRHILQALKQLVPEGDWRMPQVANLTELYKDPANAEEQEEFNITYEATGIRPSIHKYSATVWFMLQPQTKPESYQSDIGHSSIRFGCLVLKQKHPDSPGLDHVAFADHELYSLRSGRFYCGGYQE